MTTIDLGQRQLASFVALSVGLHAIALLTPRLDLDVAPPPEAPVLVFEMVEPAPMTAAPDVPKPPPPPPPPPVEKAPSAPRPVAKATPKAAPPPKALPLAKAAPAPKPAPPAPAETPPEVARPVQAPAPVARAAVTSPVVQARYEDLLHTWLVRHREYPLLASRRGLEGRPVLTVRIDRRGRVITSRVSVPSRYALLDEAAVALVSRANPFPPVPDELGGDSYEFVAPIEYRLR